MKILNLGTKNNGIEAVRRVNEDTLTFLYEGEPYVYRAYRDYEPLAEYISKCVGRAFGIRTKVGYMAFDFDKEGNAINGYATKIHQLREGESIISLEEIYDNVDPEEKSRNYFETAMYALYCLKKEYGVKVNTPKIRQKLLKMIFLDFICGNERRDCSNINFFVYRDSKGQMCIDLEDISFNRGLLLADKETLHYLDKVKSGNRKILDELTHKIKFGFVIASTDSRLRPTYERTAKALSKHIFEDEDLKAILKKAKTIDYEDFVQKAVGNKFNDLEHVKVLASLVLEQRVGDLAKIYESYAQSRLEKLHDACAANMYELVKGTERYKKDEKGALKDYDAYMYSLDDYIENGDVYAPLPDVKNFGFNFEKNEIFLEK